MFNQLSFNYSIINEILCFFVNNSVIKAQNFLKINGGDTNKIERENYVRTS